MLFCLCWREDCLITPGLVTELLGAPYLGGVKLGLGPYLPLPHVDGPCPVQSAAQLCRLCIGCCAFLFGGGSVDLTHKLLLQSMTGTCSVACSQRCSCLTYCFLLACTCCIALRVEGCAPDWEQYGMQLDTIPRCVCVSCATCLACAGCRQYTQLIVWCETQHHVCDMAYTCAAPQGGSRLL